MPDLADTGAYAEMLPEESVPQGVLTPVELHLIVRDPEVLSELQKHGAGLARDHYALAALRLGVFALRQATGVIDASAIREEGAQLLSEVRATLESNSTHLISDLKASLQQYFDPSTGQLPQRLDRLCKKDGDLENVLLRHLDGDASTVARSLAKQVGEGSPLFKMLSPEQGDGLVATLTVAIEKALEDQRELVLAEFSLDAENSALSRLVKGITSANGEVSDKLGKDLDAVRREFSLDNSEGALSRLVDRVQDTQRKITDEFSLDNKSSALSRISGLLATTSGKIDQSLTLDDEKSPLSRLRRELKVLVDDLAAKNSAFHAEVRTALDSLKARKEEAARSPRGGVEFEAALCDQVRSEVQPLGDLFEAVGSTTGENRGSKVGDGIITLGADCVAAGARLVVEAKQEQGYRMSDAIEELKIAKQNRRCQSGLFVFSEKTAPPGLEPLARHGNDVFVIWDQDDPRSDVFIRAGLAILRALAVRERMAEEEQTGAIEEIECAVRAIETVLGKLESVAAMAATVKSNGEKIQKFAEDAKRELPDHIIVLNQHVERLRSASSDD